MKPSLQIFLAVIVWLAPIIALPLYFFAFIGIGMIPGYPHATFCELITLGLAPLLSVTALLTILCFGKVTVWRIAILLIPALLSLAELAFVSLLWKFG